MIVDGCESDHISVIVVVCERDHIFRHCGCVREFFVTVMTPTVIVDAHGGDDIHHHCGCGCV